jgi:hypothetical protein
MKKLVIAVAIFSTSLAALAQAPAKDKAAPPSAAVTPKMTPEGKKFIEAFHGNWTMKDATFSMGGQEMKGKFTMNCDKAAGGWATVCKGKQSFGKDMKADALYTFSWDIVTGEGHMHEVESMGNVHDHAGKWMDEKTISLGHTGKNMEGKEETDTVTFTMVSAKEIVFKADGKSGATTNWTFSGTMKK